MMYNIPVPIKEWLKGLYAGQTLLELGTLIVFVGLLVGSIGGWISVGKYLTIVMMALCLSASTSGFAMNPRAKIAEKKIAVGQHKLKNIVQEIEGMRSTLKEISDKEKGLVRSIQKIRRDSRRKELTINKIEKELWRNTQSVSAISERIAVLRKDMRNRKDKIGVHTKYLYKSVMETRVNPVVSLIAHKDIQDTILKLEYQNILLSQENMLVDTLTKRLRELEDVSSELKHRQQDLIDNKLLLQREKERIDRDTQRRHSILASIRKKKQEYEKELKRLSEASARLKRLIAAYKKRRKELVLSGGDFARQKGKLIWPIDGKVVSKFGRQKYREFDAYIFRKGIEISPSRERVIKAVYDGTVAYADWLRGYGLVAIIDHGNKYYSVYAHASRFLVSTGSRVKVGQPIAIAGNGGPLNPRNIYFEIRYEDKPVDPLKWLKKK